VDGYLAAGSALGLLSVLAALRPAQHAWDPRNWRAPDASDAGYAVIIFIACNSLGACLRLARLILMGKLHLKVGANEFEGLPDEDVVVLLGGILAAIIIGLWTIKDGFNRLRLSALAR
jgi:hypothetical protein